MYFVVPIDHPNITSSKEMREKCKWAVVGPYYENMEAFWPCATEEEAKTLAESMNNGAPWPAWEEDWKPGEEEKYCAPFTAPKEPKKKGKK